MVTPFIMKKTKTSPPSKKPTIKELQRTIKSLEEVLKMERKDHGGKCAYYSGRVHDLVTERTNFEIRVCELEGRVPWVAAGGAVLGGLVAWAAIYIAGAI